MTFHVFLCLIDYEINSDFILFSPILQLMNYLTQASYFRLTLVLFLSIFVISCKGDSVDLEEGSFAYYTGTFKASVDGPIPLEYESFATCLMFPVKGKKNTYAIESDEMAMSFSMELKGEKFKTSYVIDIGNGMKSKVVYEGQISQDKLVFERVITSEDSKNTYKSVERFIGTMVKKI